MPVHSLQKRYFALFIFFHIFIEINLYEYTNYVLPKTSFSFLNFFYEAHILINVNLAYLFLALF